MSSPSPALVLAAATVLASPAMWLAFDGALPIDVALTRYLIAIAACWAALTLVRTFAWPDVEPAEADRLQRALVSGSEDEAEPDAA